MGKSFNLLVLGNPLSIKDGKIECGLPRYTCPSCGEANCVNGCDGSQGADENNEESEEDAFLRHKYNKSLDILEHVVLVDVNSDIDVSSPNTSQDWKLR